MLLLLIRFCLPLHFISLLMTPQENDLPAIPHGSTTGYFGSSPASCFFGAGHPLCLGTQVNCLVSIVYDSTWLKPTLFISIGTQRWWANRYSSRGIRAEDNEGSLLKNFVEIVIEKLLPFEFSDFRLFQNNSPIFSVFIHRVLDFGVFLKEVLFWTNPSPSISFFIHFIVVISRYRVPPEHIPSCNPKLPKYMFRRGDTTPPM